MNISLRWLNRYLNPGDVSASVAESDLMYAGFPTESVTALPGGDTCLDIEVTSNRGDVLCHVGMARELAAKSGRRLVMPVSEPPRTGTAEASVALRLTNQTPQACPLFTARVIRGVKVGPSPAWLREALEAVGQRSISNVVDVTNYVLFELGNPCHVFDLARLAGGALVVRFAREKEELTTLDGKKRVLSSQDLVVADAERAQSLAGVMGGADSQVSEETVDVVLEMATWDPATVRRTARRHMVRTDASHRFERYVDARTIAAAADRAAALIVEVAGGTLLKGQVSEGAPLAAPMTVRLRPERCAALLGLQVGVEEISAILRRLEIDVGPLGRGGDDLLCTIPPWRPDLTREVDLIEEVARITGLCALPSSPVLAVRPKAPQTTELARREVGSVLTGLGFYETVTFSFTSRAAAAAFGLPGQQTVAVNEERRAAEPVCRPSIVPGLLTCRRANRAAGESQPGGVRLFEVASVFGQRPDLTLVEQQNLCLLMDVPMEGANPTINELNGAVRQMRGTIEAVARAVAGLAITCEAASPHAPGFDSAAYAKVLLGGTPIGYLALVSGEQLKAHDLTQPVVAAEIALAPMLAAYPPKATLEPLPVFPGIHRDVTFDVPEATSWETVSRTIRENAPAPYVGHTFVLTYRGKQAGAGKKSVTVRVQYRDPSRTLRNEEIDAPEAALKVVMKEKLGATVRG
ncbi:MAG: phenylalanine--tRNA ligase subunit beta [Planctomycetes bacterium]|nr:phenylalanine--tRNA ligase subunit beta [Planctomycetota bacterium]